MTDPDSSPYFRPEIMEMPLYKQGKPAPDDGFKLSSNENPYPPLPSVVAAIEDALTVNRYPEGGSTELRTRLAEQHGVTPEQIFVGPGSIYVLFDLLLATSSRGDEIIYPWRSFEGYPNVVTSIGASSVKVPLNPDLSHDIEGLLRAVTPNTRAIVLCSPNNPTGNVLTTAEVEQLLAQLPSDVLVVLDEAYSEFVRDESAVDGMELLPHHSNLAVVRTFSKAYGLAGLRIGYAVSSSRVIAAAMGAGLPLAVSSVAQAAALASLDAKPELLERVSHLVTVRNRLVSGLQAQGWEVTDSQGNFVWLSTGGRTSDAEQIFLDHGVVVRAFHPEGIRITIGEDESVDAVLSAAAEVRELFE